MKKSELVELVTERMESLTRKDAESIIDSIFDGIADTLTKGERVEIRGFGSFNVKDQAARQGRNPKTGEVVQIPAKRKASFKVGKDLSERINGLRN